MRPIFTCNLIVCLVLGACLGATATLARAQDFEVRHGMEVGDVWRYSTTLDILISEAREAESVMGRLVQTIHVELEAVRDDGEGGLVVRGTFNRITSVWRRGDKQYEFSWTRPAEPDDDAEVETPDLAAEEPLAPAEAFRSAHQFLAQRPFELVVSEAGVIRNVTGLNGAALILRRAPELDASALGMFLPPRFAEQLEPLWLADGAADASKAGDTWERARRVAMGPAGALEFKTSWRVEKHRNDSLTCRGALEARAIAPEEASPAQPVVEVLRGRGEASLEWHLADGRVQSRDEKLDLATRWTLNDLELTIAQVSTRRLARLD